MNRYLHRIILILFVGILASSLLPASPLDDLKNINVLLEKGIEVTFLSPTFSDGVLCTQEGGVIKGPDIRIQAKKILYTKKMVNKEPVIKVVAEGDVALEFNNYFFVGDRLEYDFVLKQGTIYEARSSMEPWYFGGKTVELLADGSYKIHEGFVTTSENYSTDWQITASEAHLYKSGVFRAQDVQFKLLHLPFFWLPSFKLNLNSIFDNPIRYNVSWGGSRHTRFEIQYELFSWGRLKNFVRLDYRLKRGFGGGFYTLYNSPDRKENFEMINYVARDSSAVNRHERTRYRFQGVYDKEWDDDNSAILASWDKLSDQYMATDYDDRNLEIEKAGRTQFLFRRQQEDFWIANFCTRVRVNNFQTLKQELPSLEFAWKPFTLGSSEIISDNLWRFSYLDFQYAKHSDNVHNFNSLRLEFNHRLYRSYRTGIFTTTPEVAALAIYYGSSPHSSDHWVTVGKASLETNTRFYKDYFHFKHMVKPFVRYQFLTYPGVSPRKHYIFDIDDGWYKLNMGTFGIENSFFTKNRYAPVSRWVHVNLFAHIFFDTPTVTRTIPKIYTQVIFNPSPVFQQIYTVGWDTQRQNFDHFNFRHEWTISQNTAFTLEWRHRGSYDWRKADKTNFILDSFRSEDRLRHSQLSDRRDTLLLHIFHRFHPSWAIEFQSRHGWNRLYEPKYSEYEIDFLGTIQTALNFKLSIQRKEYDRSDNRIALYFNIGLPHPSLGSEKSAPVLDF